MKNQLIFATILLASSANAEILHFTDVHKLVDSRVKCDQSKVTPPSYGDGALYGCISAGAETAKIFINEDPKTGNVKNIKIMWNDWFRDVGFGIHPDKIQASKYLNTVSDLFTPKLTKQLNNVFFNTSKNIKFETENFSVTYTYDRGPAIDERLITITPK